jgi:hypothetical protein
MKAFLLALVLVLVGCNDNDDNKTQEPVPVVTETPAATPTPQAKGKWCPANRADFSPCNPAAAPEAMSECKIGDQFTGCKGAFDCKESC